MAIFYYHMVKFNGVFSVETSASVYHFRVAVNLTMKARLSAKLSIRKLALFAYE